MSMRALLFVLLWLQAITGFTAELRDHAAVRIATNTWVIHGPLGDPSVENQGFMNNPAFVVTRDGVVVIDPGSSLQAGRMVLRQIRKITAKPVTHVLNTHVHGDHWLGNHAIHDAFPQATIMAHPLMIQAARNGEATHWLKLMDQLTQGFTHGTRAVIPTVPVVEDQSFAVGGITFRVLAPPNAHSGSDIMIHVIEEAVLFLGDNVMNGRFGRMDEGNFTGNIAACTRALEVTAKIFVPGHGASGSRDIIAAYRNYLATLFETVKIEYDKGKMDYEMKETVRAKLSPYTTWVGFDLNFGRHLSIALLEIEAM